MKSNFLRWFAIILILETGLLHILTAQAEYEEAAYIGYLFAANFFGTLLAAFGIYHKQFWGWMLGCSLPQVPLPVIAGAEQLACPA